MNITIFGIVYASKRFKTVCCIVFNLKVCKIKECICLLATYYRFLELLGISKCNKNVQLIFKKFIFAPFTGLGILLAQFKIDFGNNMQIPIRLERIVRKTYRSAATGRAWNPKTPFTNTWWVNSMVGWALPERVVVIYGRHFCYVGNNNKFLWMFRVRWGKRSQFVFGIYFFSPWMIRQMFQRHLWA